jgi:stage II sporulation protein P
MNAAGTGENVSLEVFNSKTVVKPELSDDEITMNITVISDVNIGEITGNYDFTSPAGREKLKTSAEAGIKKDLEENPSIEVMIDLHRNSGDNKVIMLNGEETAQVMMFNGLCRDQSGPLTNLDNPYLQDNLSFSLQLQLKSLELYPGLFRKNYLKSYRFNMHFRPKSLLVELGTVKNTVQSAKNALEPFAQILDSVLQGSAAVTE